MGLGTTHGCWHGAYSAFMRWRQMIAEVAGFPPLMLMENFYTEGSLIPTFPSIGADEGDQNKALTSMVERGGHGMPKSVFANHETLKRLPISWERFASDPLVKLLNHSDCDGSIAASDCGPIADRLEEILPLLPAGDAGGHIGFWRDKTADFINGLRAAAAAGEDVEFH